MNGTFTKLWKRGWGVPFLAALMLLCCGGITLHAQQDPCKTDTLRLNTGWNHLTNSLDGIGAYSNFWKVIADPSPNTTEPRPAITIPTYGAWAAALPNSRWMSSYPSASNDTNGTYTFQACFCIGQKPGKVKFVGDLLADDRARVYINGTLIGSTPLSYAFLNPATHIDIDVTQYVKVGKNCIEIEVDNTGSVAMGFDLAGYVTATNALAFDKPQCCDRSGSIIGMKFWDKNCNGKQDVGDVGLAGWTIKATNGVNTWTTTTDGLGNYYFTNLPAGTYTVSEVNQLGWTQSYPTGAGTYSVTLLAGQVISNRDFGNCRNQPTDGCFLTQRDSIWCVTDATGAIAYNYRFDIKSLIGCNGSLSAAVAVASPVGVSVSPASFPVSNAWSTQNLNIYGPGAVAGAMVKLVVTVCCKTPGAQDVCCSDTITVKLPECHPVQQGCFQIVEDSVYCKEGPNGQSIYGWCFKVKNLSNCPATYFTFYGPAGVTINPVTIVLGYLAPGATSGSYCVQISGPMAVPGPLVLNGVMCNRERTCCCDGSITIKLPDCKPHGCCDDFLKRFGKLTNSASSNGNTTVNGWMAAAGPGGTPIIKVEATLANLSINGLPAYGYFVNGAIANPFGFTTGVMTPYGNELIWPTIGTGVAMNFPTPFNLRLKFQPMAPGVWKDVVRYCIRFRFTDKNCITCDTVICFSRIRYKFIIWADASHLKTGEKGSSLLSSGGAPGIDGYLVGSDSATLALTLPSFPAELGAGHYVGLSVSANDANLTGANASGYSFLVANGMATSEFDAQAGSSISLGLSYDDFGAKNAIEHELGFRYVLDSDPLDTLEESVSLVIRRESLTGGDILGSAGSNLRSVKTYALHLENANGSKEPIDRLVLGTRGGTTILAVGPTANDTTVAIGFRANSSGGRAAVEVRGEAVGIEAGGSQNPIYVTLAGVQGAPTVHFATYNTLGQLISEGDLILSESLPSSVTRDGSEGSGTTGTTMLEQSYPNPATHSATINFHLDTPASSVSLVLNDATGRQVVRLIDAESLAAGEHAVYLNADGLATGTYYYTISVGDHRETRAMQIVK